MTTKRSRSRTIGVASARNLAMELVRVTEGAAIAAPSVTRTSSMARLRALATPMVRERERLVVIACRHVGCARPSEGARYDPDALPPCASASTVGPLSILASGYTVYVA